VSSLICCCKRYLQIHLAALQTTFSTLLKLKVNNFCLKNIIDMLRSLYWLSLNSAPILSSSSFWSILFLFWYLVLFIPSVPVILEILQSLTSHMKLRFTLSAVSRRKRMNQFYPLFSFQIYSFHPSTFYYTSFEFLIFEIDFSILFSFRYWFY